MQKIKELLMTIVIITLLVILGVVISCTNLGQKRDVKTYNHGICANCAKGRYELFDAEGVTRFYLKCNKCNYIVRVYSQVWLTDENYEREGNK